MAATGFKFFQLLERHGAFKGALVGEIHYVPFWFVTGTLRVVVLACRDELGLVRVGPLVTTAVPTHPISLHEEW